MSLHDRYATALEKLPSLEVSFGIGGLQLFSVASLDDEQAGYSRTPDGKPLPEQNGGWKTNWLVIGRETCCGDPLFIDTADPHLPVFTAAHGQGSWDPQQIAISLDVFVACFQEFALIAKSRENPVAMKEHPVEDAERSAFLSRIEQLNQGPTGQEFWELAISF